jgi:outer membrane assembly lipoprotein YfiO
VSTLILLSLVSGSAHAAWTWTPEIGRWINLKRQPRETAGLQYQYAEQVLTEGDTEKAIQEYEKILRYFPDSSYCELAQYSIGRALEAQEDYKEAVEAYQEVIDNYPNSRLFDNVLKKQRGIADHYFNEGVKREEKFVLLRGSNFDKAIETYRKVINNQPFSELSAEAQYRIGLCYMKLELYEEASAEFQKVIDFHPSSEWAAEAAYGTAECKYNQVLPSEYDKSAVDDALAKFRFFLRMYPDSSRAEEARAKLDELEERAAEHEFNIAMYYHRYMKYDSARMYFDSITRDYPETQWAEKARETLEQMPRSRF